MIVEQPRLVLIETDEIEVQILYPVVIENVLGSDQLAEI